MLRKTAIVIQLVILLTGCARNGMRKGFYIGGGGGPGVTMARFHSSEDTAHRETEFEFAVQGELRLGYAPTDQLAFYYSHKSAVMPSQLGNLPDNPLFYLVGIPLVPFFIAHNTIGLGGIYYLSPRAPSMYFGGSMGLGVWPDWSVEEIKTGFGCSLHVGTEFSKNFRYGLGLSIGGPLEIVTGIMEFHYDFY